MGYGYGYPTAYRYGSYRLHKREAEAEPEADAYCGSVYGLGSYGYNSGLYGYRGYSAYPLNYGYGYPSAYRYGSYRLHKREAEAEPEVMLTTAVLTDTDTHLMATDHTDTGLML